MCGCCFIILIIHFGFCLFELGLLFIDIYKACRNSYKERKAAKNNPQINV
jgi:hypothetical protein